MGTEKVVYFVDILSTSIHKTGEADSDRRRESRIYRKYTTEGMFYLWLMQINKRFLSEMRCNH